MNTLITGMTGSGKSYTFQTITKEIDLPIIGLSNKIEDLYQLERQSGNEFIRIDVNNKTKLKQLPPKNIFFVFGFMTFKEKIAFIDDLALRIMQKKNLILYIDEAHEVLSETGTYSKQLESLIAGARAKNIHIILITQRPQSIKKSVINNCVWRLCFKTTEKNSVKAMVDHMQNITESDIRNLDKYEFYIYNAYSGEIELSKI